VLALPTKWIDSRVARPELLSGVVLRDSALARLWRHYLANGFAMAGEFSPAAASLFARHSVELLAQALEEAHRDKPSPSDAWRAAMFVRACQLIALKFGEPSLTPNQIAGALHVSTRTLERIFAIYGETVMRRLFDERVRQAAKLLSKPEAARRSVTEIAFACGFNDASHFGRVFAAKMHMTPSQWRRRTQ
jgi:AraC-like DNA-binding protein